MRHQTDIDKMNTNRNLFFMSLPIFVELLLQLLVGNIDQMMVSRVSQQSVASIVNANQIMNLVIIVLSMASTAATVILSQYLGAEDKANSSRTCMVSILMITVVSLLSTLLVFAGYKMCIRDSLKGAPCPLKDVRREDIDMLFVRENSEGEYAGSGSWLFKGKPLSLIHI